MRRAIVSLCALACSAAAVAVPAASAGAAPKPVKLRLLAINDFHGNIEPPAGSSGTVQTGFDKATGKPTTTMVGGAAYLATHLKRLEAGAPGRYEFVGAGDLIGASPLASGLFHDEPTVDALSQMGLDLTSVGNHEFDEGVDELLRLQTGGCHPVDGCQFEPTFSGAAFQWLAANVRYEDSDRTILPPYEIRKAGGVRVAYIGMTLKGTPDIVTPDGVRGLVFDDEADTVNRLVGKLAKRGIQAFVVLVHQGGQQNAPFAKGYTDVNGCENPTGDIFSIVNRLDTRVDVVLSAHTHQPYVCRKRGMLVTSAASFGRLITRVDMTLSKRTRDVSTMFARNELVTRDVTPDPKVQAIVQKAVDEAKPIASKVVGSTSSGTITRTQTPAGESPLGDLIADSQLAATAPADKGGAVIAFMNPGGIRADLVPSGGGNQVTYNDLYTVQPFANTLVVKTMTGKQIEALLEQQVYDPANLRILQVSKGFTYTWKASGPAGDHVDPSTIKLDGTTLDPNADYRVTMNSFLATGGDGFTVFNEGTDQLGGDVDIDAAVAYFGANSPVAPGPADRITKG